MSRLRAICCESTSVRTAEELWAEAWPDVPWEDASATDKKLFLDHANSLADWHATR